MNKKNGIPSNSLCEQSTLDADFVIVSLALVPWSYPYWTSRQCLMYELAFHVPVMYARERIYVRQLLTAKFWQTWRSHQKQVPLQPPPGLCIYEPAISAPYIPGHIKLDKWLQKRYVTNILKKIPREYREKIYLYIWDPICAQYIDMIQPKRVIYHPYDKLDLISQTSDDASLVRKFEEMVVDRADAIITPHQKVADTISHNNITVISNGFMPSLFTPPPKIAANAPDFYSSIPQPRLGYIGVINSKINFPLLLELATERPDWSFVFIGPRNPGKWQDAAAFQDFRRRNNVYFHEGVNFTEVSKYMAEIDIGLIPYCLSDWASFSQSPLKLYQFWALGKPVVSMPLPNLANEPGILSIAKTSQEWISMIEWEMTHDNVDWQEVRIGKAADFSWSRQAEKVIDVLNSI